jgi:ABC-type Fe3+ transport system permease subunit
MLTIAILMFLGIRKYVSLRQYAMLSKGGRWKPRVAKPKGWQAVLIYLVVLPMLLISIFPQVGVVLLAFSESWSGTWPQGFTTAHIQSIITQPDIERVIMNSVMYSTAAIIVILLLSLTASYASSRFKKSKLGPVLDSLSTIPIAVPGIVIAMSYFFFFAKVFPDTPLDPTNLLGFNPAMVLVLAYSIRRLPFAARSISAGIQQVHVSLEEAALNLGAGRWKALTGILMPLILLNLLGGAMLSFVYCMSETSVGITLGSINPEYYPITARMVELMTSAVGSANLAAALGVFLMTVQIIAIVLANVITKQRYSFIGLT